MSSSLSGIPVEKRKQLAATLGLFAVLFVAVGAVAATGTRTGVVDAFIVVALVVAVVLALMAWGVLHSAQLDEAEQRLDAAIEDAVRAGGRSLCDCGHEHDPDELHLVDEHGNPVEGELQHVTGARCAHDGTGADCAHSCDACVLAGMRSAPAASVSRPHSAPAPRPGARRPKPGPGRS